MLATSTVDSSFTDLSPSPIKSNDDANQPLTGTSLLMHSSFGVRRHSDDVTNSSFTTTTTFRPRRSISSSGDQRQTRHVVSMLDHYSQPTKDESFNDDDEDLGNELNLAVVIGQEDNQSLKDSSIRQVNQENGSLDVAFIDETEFERNLSNQKTDAAVGEQEVLKEKSLNQNEELEDILKRNENRSIRLTDSDVRRKLNYSH